MRYLILFLILVASAGADYQRAESLLADVVINTTLDIHLSPGDILSNVSLALFVRPISYGPQKIIAISSEPKGSFGKDSLDFIMHPRQSTPIVVDGTVRMAASPQVTSKVVFPIDTIALPSDILVYTKPSALADSANPLILTRARTLFTDQDDLYFVVQRFAQFAHDTVRYDLTSINKRSKDLASGILLSRDGVCDDISNLFIALCRSAGIPARFVAGLAYTDNEIFVDPWQPHGWAEVYFPNIGWIPFDPTFGQYGWVDVSHIKLRESADSGTPALHLEWTGQGVNVSISPLDFGVDVLEVGQDRLPRVGLDVRLSQDTLVFGKDEVLDVVMMNLQGGYETSTVFLADTEGLLIKGPNNQTVVLRPFQSVHMNFTVSLEEVQPQDSIMTYPLLFYGERNFSMELRSEPGQVKNPGDEVVLSAKTQIPRFTWEETSEIIKEEKLSFWQWLIQSINSLFRGL